jgi:hypothetical protein
MKDPKFIKLFEKAFSAGDSYAVQAESLRSLGKCGSKKQLDFLKEAETRKSWRNVVGKAAAEASDLIMKK